MRCVSETHQPDPMQMFPANYRLVMLLPPLLLYLKNLTMELALSSLFYIKRSKIQLRKTFFQYYNSRSC